MSTTSDVAAAIVTKLNENRENWSIDFEAKRYWHPLKDLADFETLKVLVVPYSRTREVASRGGARFFIHTIHIGVAKRVDPDTLTEADELGALVMEIENYIDTLDLGMSNLTWMPGGSELLALSSPESLEQERKFLSVLSVVFRELEDV